MASVSNINYSSIDETYPLAGKDNDSQGFRDNFNYIKTNFQTTKSELEDLMENTAKTDTDNDFGNVKISRANLIYCSEAVNVAGNVSTSADIDFSLGNYQTFRITANNVVLNIKNFPISGTAGKIRVHLTNSNSVSTYFQYMVNFQPVNGGVLKKNSNSVTLLTPIQCTATNSISDQITCTSTATLTVNQPIQFTGTSFDSNIITNNIYYVKTINDSTHFTVSESVDATGVAGVLKSDLAGGAGSLLYITPKITVASGTNPLIIDFWTLDGGATVYMDYKGIYV